MKKLSFTLSILGMLFIGCSNTPKCDDGDVKKLVDDIIKQEMKKLDPKMPQALKLMDISYSDFITDNIDEKAKKTTCRAKIKMDVAGDKFEDIFKYTAQYTSDGKLYVEVYDR